MTRASKSSRLRTVVARRVSAVRLVAAVGFVLLMPRESPTAVSASGQARQSDRIRTARARGGSPRAALLTERVLLPQSAASWLNARHVGDRLLLALRAGAIRVSSTRGTERRVLLLLFESLDTDRPSLRLAHALHARIPTSTRRERAGALLRARGANACELLVVSENRSVALCGWRGL